MWLSWLINWLSWLINWLRTGSLSQSESEGENVSETYSSFVFESSGGRTEYDFDDFDTRFSYLNDFLFYQQNWVNDTGAGPSIMIPPTLQDSQNGNNMVLQQANNTNYTGVEQSNSIMIRPVSQDQDELHIANNGSDTGYGDKDNTCPDTIRISSNTTPAGVDSHGTGKICISLEVLQQHFTMSMEDAAKKLNVSKTTLKRRCRDNGILRWPNYRKRKRIINERSPNPKNVNKLVQNKKDDTNKSTRRQAKIVSLLGEASSSNVTIKATYGDDIVKFPFSVSSGLNDLKEKVCERLEIDIPIKLKCKDDDGDLILISCDDALHELFGNRLSTSVDHNTTFDFLVLFSPATQIQTELVRNRDMNV